MGKFSSPLPKGCRFTSGFGKRWGTLHAGADFGPPRPGQSGTPVYAIHSGPILATGYGYGRANDRIPYHSGRFIWQDIGSHGGDRIRIYYGHLASSRVRAGQKVKAGQLIGYMGGSGSSGENHFAIHLHIGVAQNSTRPVAAATRSHGAGWIDPVPWLRSKGVTVGATAPKKSNTTTASSSSATTKATSIVYTNRPNVTLYKNRGNNKKIAGRTRAQNYKLALIRREGSWGYVRWKGGRAWVPWSHLSTKKTPVVKYTNRPNAPIYVNRGNNKRLDPQQPTAKGYALAVVKTEGSWTLVRWKSNNRWIATAHLSNTR